jgi:hypothetical protein
MGIDSKIKMEEEVANTCRSFGSNSAYYPAYIVISEGKEVPALFTIDQLNIAMARAARNSEDMPKEGSTFFSWLFS